ncbi:MAG TPA: glyoxalase/bleomycin resistance/extradiol dioxygenase family protein [Chitinophagaceae bacterium]|nr:glyoxalase/bleomycin resistance/extradiol dioxygenase family protein [Chitinophagaceae bacterium]
MKLYAYIGFNGNCEEALNFYKDAFDGEITQLGRYGESPMKTPEEIKDKIIHGRVQFGDAMLMASDRMNEKQFNRSGDISLSAQCETTDQLEKIFSKMSEGGKVTMPLQDQFWGAKFGMLTDKFGVHWMFNCENKK